MKSEKDNCEIEETAEAYLVPDVLKGTAIAEHAKTFVHEMFVQLLPGSLNCHVSESVPIEVERLQDF